MHHNNKIHWLYLSALDNKDSLSGEAGQHSDGVTGDKVKKWQHILQY